MKLNDYLIKQKMTSLRFAKMLRVSTSAISKWRIGTRLPRPGMIARIDKLTNGRVQLKDWY